MSIVQSLQKYLHTGGIIYAEVPFEIWAGLHIEYDPVTHVNFFIQHSLKQLFWRAGYEVMASRQEPGTYAGAHNEIIWLLAKRGASGEALQHAPLTSWSKLLSPGRYHTLRRMLRGLWGSRVEG